MTELLGTVRPNSTAQVSHVSGQPIGFGSILTGDATYVAATGALNQDQISTFVSDANVSVNRFWYLTPNASASGTAYFGLYDASLNLISDLGATTTTATDQSYFETAAFTTVNLTLGSRYYICTNIDNSLSVAASQPARPRTQENLECFTILFLLAL